MKLDRFLATIKVLGLNSVASTIFMCLTIVQGLVGNMQMTIAAGAAAITTAILALGDRP